MAEIIVLVIILILVAAIFLKLQRPRSGSTINYIPAGPLCTPTELAFLTALDQTMEPGQRVFAKVRLIDVLHPPRGNVAARNRIIQKHLDFVVCDSKTTKPLYAIELNDRSHNQPRRRDRDTQVADMMASAGIPLIFQKARASYSPEDLRASINECLNASAG